MASNRRNRVILLTCVLLPCVAAAAEELTITTYYPSPRGIYRNLRSTGNTYLAYLPGAASGAVGIGTTADLLAGPLDLRFAVTPDPTNPDGAGNCAAGYHWYDDNGNVAADPTECKRSALTVMTTGNVGIGTRDPAAKLHVVGEAEVTNWDNLLVLQNLDPTPIAGSANDAVGISFDAQTRDWAIAATNPSSGFGDEKFLIYDADPAAPFPEGGRLVIDRDGHVGVGVGDKDIAARLTIYEPGESVVQADLTTGLASAGVHIQTDFTIDAFTPGVFWSTQDENATLPKAGIYLKEAAAGTGTSMYFGTSNNYTVGITNDALVIEPTGNVTVGGQIKIAGGTPPLVNSVLTAVDAEGLADWRPPAAGIVGTCTASNPPLGIFTPTCTIPGARFMVLSGVDGTHGGSAMTFFCRVVNQGILSPAVQGEVSNGPLGSNAVTCSFVGFS